MPSVQGTPISITQLATLLAANPVLAAFASAAKPIPPQSAGYPAGGVWIANGSGLVQRAPTTDLTYNTNGNISLAALLALDL
jgi:hypothetical protein